MSINRWKFHYMGRQGWWKPAERIEADYPSHPMEEEYVLYADHLAALQALTPATARIHAGCACPTNAHLPNCAYAASPQPSTPSADGLAEALAHELKRLRSIEELTEFGKGALSVAETLEAALARAREGR